MAGKPTLNFDAPLPKPTRKRRSSKYDPILEEFLAANKPSAQVVLKGVKNQAIGAGLKLAVSRAGVEDKVHVSQRQEGVWLVRKDMNVENMTRPSANG